MINIITTTPKITFMHVRDSAQKYSFQLLHRFTWYDTTFLQKTC